MGKPRFRPVQVVKNPRHFGRSNEAERVVPDGLSEGELAWAWYQHRVALAVRAELVKRDLPLLILAKAVGENEAWLERKLRGQAPADLGEIFEWALRLGPHILPPIDGREDLGFPKLGVEI
jgi:hypothetical protein